MVNILYSRYAIYIISTFAALAGVLFGYDTGVISGAILFIRHDFALSPLMIGVTVSVMLFGAMAGALLSGTLTNMLGRRILLLGVALTFVAGTLLAAFAPNLVCLFIGRFILGLAVGSGSFAAPLYLAEAAPPAIRGFLVSLNQLMITLGIMLAYVVDLGFSDTGNWRAMLGFGLVPAGLLALGALLLPESPRWVLLRGNYDGARQILQAIRNKRDVSEELEAIQAPPAQQAASQFKTLFSPWVRPALYLGLALAFFQQAVGINIIVYYAPTILQIAGFEHETRALLATVGIGAVNVIFTVAALYLLDRWGRRPLLLLGLIGMLIGLLLVSLDFLTSISLEEKWLAVGGMFLYIAAFAISLGPIAWLMCAEIFPLSARGAGVSISTAANWLFNGLVALTFLELAEHLGIHTAFMCYTAICALGLLFVYYFVPETKGVSLEEIEAHLKAGKAVRKLGC